MIAGLLTLLALLTFAYDTEIRWGLGTSILMSFLVGFFIEENAGRVAEQVLPPSVNGQLTLAQSCER